MEELQSTEVLDREILEDARKKAHRALKSGEDTISENNAKWDKKFNDAVLKLDAEYKKSEKDENMRVTARLPIDKNRIKMEKLETLLKNAVLTWYKSLNRANILELLSEKLLKGISSCKDEMKPQELKVSYNGLEENEAKDLLKSLNIDCSSLTVSPLQDKNSYPWIILDTRNIRMSASIQDLIDTLLLNKREELTCALLGDEFMRAS
ncbi:MAG: hypothetical protein FWC01_02330 [Treponema sp.]|nr:hypothetical protein [Treponema sp.]MCL2237832.1 hypothetical protein [Treponema sp.]